MNEIGKTFCSACAGEVKRYIKCVKCKKNFHVHCAIKLIGLYVSNEGIVCREDIRGEGKYFSQRKLATPLLGNKDSVCTILEYKLMNKIIKEMETENKF